MFLDGCAKLLDGFQPASASPGVDILQMLFGVLPRSVAPEVGQKIPPTEGSPQLRILPTESLPLLQLARAEPAEVAPQRPQRSFLQSPVLGGHLATHFVDGLARQRHHMVAVENLLGIGKIGLHPALEGRTHVHGHFHDLLRARLMLNKLLGKLPNGLGVPPQLHEQQPATVKIGEAAHVAVALAPTGLIDSDALDLAPILLGVGLPNVVMNQPPESRVVNAEGRGCFRHRHLLAQQKRPCLKQQCKAASRPRPGHFHLMHSALLTTRAWHPSHQLGLILPEIQMPPAALPPVVDRATLTTFRALGTGFALAKIQFQEQVFRLAFQAAGGHNPRVP